MKKEETTMKRLTKLLVLTLALAALLTVSAFAADFTHCADALNDLGLFQGTDSGYDLDRAPTRAEAAAMLVRLLGAEEEAQKMEEYTAPFTDLRDWAKPYVQYLYDNGLTNGKSETTFGYSDKCTAQQYATFLLRALGYSDAENGDFTYATAMDFAREKGVVDYANCDEKNFLRDDVVAMSFTALATAPKSGEADLLTKLVKDGAIADAKGYDEMFEMYRDYLKAATADAGATKTSMNIAMTMDMKMAGIDFLSGSIKLDTAMDLNAEKMDSSKMAMKGTIDMAINPDLASEMGLTAEEAKMSSAIEYYYTDGCYYMNMEGLKIKMPLSFEDVMSQTAGLSGSALTETASEPICLLKDISGSGSSSGTATYTLTYAGSAMSGLMDTIMGMIGENAATDGITSVTEVPDISLKDTTISVTVRNGHMTGMKLKLDMSMVVEGETMNLALDMNVTDVQFGNSVSVTLPSDLNTYEEIIGGADTPAA